MNTKLMDTFAQHIKYTETTMCEHIANIETLQIDVDSRNIAIKNMYASHSNLVHYFPELDLGFILDMIDHKKSEAIELSEELDIHKKDLANKKHVIDDSIRILIGIWTKLDTGDGASKTRYW